MPQIFNTKSRMLVRSMGALEAPGKGGVPSGGRSLTLHVGDIGSEALGRVEGLGLTVARQPGQDRRQQGANDTWEEDLRGGPGRNEPSPARRFRRRRPAPDLLGRVLVALPPLSGRDQTPGHLTIAFTSSCSRPLAASVIRKSQESCRHAVWLLRGGTLVAPCFPEADARGVSLRRSEWIDAVGSTRRRSAAASTTKLAARPVSGLQAAERAGTRALTLAHQSGWRIGKRLSRRGSAPPGPCFPCGPLRAAPRRCRAADVAMGCPNGQRERDVEERP